MREELDSLSSAIDLYKSVSDGKNEGSIDIQNIIRDALQKIWNLLGTDGITIGKIANSFSRTSYGSVEEFKSRIMNLQVLYSKNNKGIFSTELLSLFGVSNPEMLIMRGKIEGISRPLLETSFQVNDVLNRKTGQAGNREEGGVDLEGVPAILSTCLPTYEALMSSSSGINEIINYELINPLAEDAPFIQRQFGRIIATYEKKENKISEINRLLRKIENLKVLKKRGMTNDIKKIEGLIAKKSKELDLLIGQIQTMKTSFSLDDISVYILKKFGFYTKKKKKNYLEIITADKIKGKIRRSISVGVHKKHAELREIRVIEGSILRMIKMFEKIKEKYGKLIDEAEDPVKKTELINLLRIELDNWEIESNTLIEGFSFRKVRLLRDRIISELLSKK